MPMVNFIWPVILGMTVSHKPKIKKAKFGDGYAERAPDGLNPDLRKFSITVKGENNMIDDVDNFLHQHGGYRAFYFTPSDTKQPTKVICEEWKRKRIPGHGFKFQITATFEEVQ